MRVDGAPAELRSWLDESRRWAEDALERALPSADAPPRRLHEAMRYAVFGGGKRLRPALVRLACRHFGGTDEGALAPAAAVELIHTYSLVHDDLPCMDDDELRRGRPTCHVVYGDALAVLVGDALLTLAFETLGDAPAGLVRVLARAAGAAGMVGGQVLDLESSAAGAAPELASVRAIHRLKTAALFEASAELGARAAGAAEDACARAADFGRALGLAFQAQDDVLDVTGDARTLGKTPGKDAQLDKATLVAALGLAGARAEAAKLADEAERAAAALGPGAGGSGDLPRDLVRFVVERSA